MILKRPTKLFERFLDSDVKTDLLIFFHDTPHVSDTVEGLARRLDHDLADVRRVLADLEEIGVVRKTETYSFDDKKDVELQQRILQELAVTGSPDLSRTVQMETVKTEISLLDKLLPDGIPFSTAILVLADPEAGKEILTTQLVSEALKRGDSALFITLDNFPDFIRASVTDLIGQFDGKIGSLILIDCYSRTLGSEGYEALSVSPENLAEISAGLSEVVRRKNPKLIVFDSISTVIRKRHVRSALEFLQVIVAKTRQAGSICFVTMNRKAFHAAIIAAAQEIVDGVFEMKMEEETSGLARYIRISKMMGVKHSTAWTKFDIDEPKGILKST